MKKKAEAIRVDQLLVERGLAESRTQAQSMVMAGCVFTATKRLDKPGMKIAGDALLEVKGPAHPWASRGGIKLDHAIDHFAIDIDGRICLDLGASTGGFTDVLLARGASRVYAVDVGHGQIVWRLRQDPRVVVLDRTNARDLRAELVPDPVALITCDVSFIGLEKALPAAIELVGPGARLMALVKPQFEVGKGRVGRGGVVRDTALHDEVCARVAAWIDGQSGWSTDGITESPITGPKGNREFFVAATKA